MAWKHGIKDLLLVSAAFTIAAAPGIGSPQALHARSRNAPRDSTLEANQGVVLRIERTPADEQDLILVTDWKGKIRIVLNPQACRITPDTIRFFTQQIVVQDSGGKDVPATILNYFGRCLEYPPSGRRHHTSYIRVASLTQ